MNRIKFITLGCKVNQYETEAMREAVLARGLRESDEGPSEFVVINTCTVTEGADRENRYWIRRARRENPFAKIVVTGCWVQRNRKEVEALPDVDLVLANEEKPDLAGHIFEGCGTSEVQSRPVHSRQEYSALQISGFRGHARAFVKIQDGCNHACSFCKVVLVRGRSRSRQVSEIVAEAERLRDSGFREIVLTGIQLGAYGVDLEPHENLVSVLERLSEIPGIERVRLSSIEPTDVKPDLVRAMKEIPKVCPQLHIPLQSGDDEILRRMNRRYGRNFYLDLARSLRRDIPDFCLSMDVMAGFPGEEDHHFQNTLTLLQETRPIRVHAFPYSRREGTRASRFEGDVPGPVIRERMARLLAFSKAVAAEEKRNFVGQCLPVLVEEKSSDKGLYQGHTSNYLKVYFEGSEDSIGKTVPVRLLEIAGDGLLGRSEGRGE